MQLNSSDRLLRLTALWALSESGLGGVLHAIKAPFTGLFLGGFAVVIVALLAHHTRHQWKTIISATLLVIGVKFMASPHTPFTAYVAVGFQGLLGAILFSIFRVNAFSVAVYGMVALAESALQRLLMTTLVFGKSIWEAIDVFFGSIAKELRLSVSVSYSYTFMGLYVVVYVIAGLAIGLWTARLIKSLEAQAPMVWRRYSQWHEQAKEVAPKRRRYKALYTLLMLFFICIVFATQGWGTKALYAVARTLAAILLLMYVVAPVVRWLMSRWMKNNNAVTPVMDLMPQLKKFVLPSWQMAKHEKKGVSVYSAFVKNLLMLSLYAQPVDKGKEPTIE